MPWRASDASKHKAGLSPHQARVWARVANEALQRCQDDGDTDCEGRAIRIANNAVGKAMDESEVYTLLLKEELPLRYTLGIVYEPMAEDLQGDFAKAATIQAAAWEFMRRLQGRRTLTKWAYTLLGAIVKSLKTKTPLRLDVTDMIAEITKAEGLLGDQHSNWDEGLGEVVESYCMPCNGAIDGHVIKQGTWLLGVVWSPDYFPKIQAGERTGYSMGGKGRRRFVEDMALA